MPSFRRPLLPAALLSLALALAGCGWEVPPVEELPPLVLSADAGTPAKPPPTTPTTPAGPPPAAPQGVTAVAGDASVRVRWSEASGNGYPVLSYTVELTPENGLGDRFSFTAPAPSTELSVAGYLPVNVRYNVQVRAVTQVGMGPPSLPVSGVMPYVGSCSTVHRESQWRATSGLYMVVLGGKPLQVYCEMTTTTGAWTLVLHSAWTTGQLPTDYRLFQSLPAWGSSGVGWPSDFSGHLGNAPYVMPLEAMRALLEGTFYGRLLRFQSDGARSLTELYGATMGPDYTLNGYNVDMVASQLCGGRTDCFVGAFAPFSTAESGTSGSSCASQNHGLGWWYAGSGCSRHHPFRTDDRALFSGNSSDPTTNHWSWWVQ